MRSGNGRHRRARQAPAFVVAAGVTGAGIALPLLSVGAAQAEDAGTWDRVAECESGGLWSSNSGSGYYGGLQLTQDTWEEYGGTEYAKRPDLASRTQQITVAEKILADRGPSAWPSCATESGLAEGGKDDGKDDGAGSEDPSETPSPEPPEADPTPSPGDSSNPGESSPSPSPSKPSKPSGPSEPPESSEPSEPSTPESSQPPSNEPSEPPASSEPDTDPSQPDGSGESSGQPGGEQPAEPAPPRDGDGTGKHRGQPDEREHADPDHPSRGEDGERGSGKHRQEGDDYRVQRGDSLAAIAAEFELDGGWSALYERNRETVGSNPDLILPGQQLRL